jgi:hypothetical protein
MANFLRLLLIFKIHVNVQKDKKQRPPLLVKMATKLLVQKLVSNLTHFFSNLGTIVEFEIV